VNVELQNRTAVVFGAGQAPGRTVGNGRATAIAYARAGARVLCVDRDIATARETAGMIRSDGGTAESRAADVRDESAIASAIEACCELWGRLDILHNNVGVSSEVGDRPVTEIPLDIFDLVLAVNLRSMVASIKHALPIMREQGAGVITNISSAAVFNGHPNVGYRTSKAAVIALTEQVAIQNARFGVRANTILPGLLETPIGVDNRVTADVSYDEVVAMRNREVPLRGKMGTAWDIANAAVFLASDCAQYITGVTLPVDGGQSVQRGRQAIGAEQAGLEASETRA
jgi:NAD(P)-dependent dehydrogenase (short-subunit alcohol dehydrogenase family)